MLQIVAFVLVMFVVLVVFSITIIYENNNNIHSNKVKLI